MSDNIRVIVRIRPMNSKEIERGTRVCVSFPGENMIEVLGKPFAFDSVIQPESTQLEVYNIITKPIIFEILKGFNATIFMYGQTSAGKSFTMEGVLSDPNLKGLIPRTIDGIFDHIAEKQGDIVFTIKVSYYEIYLEKIVDLFDTSKNNLAVAEDKNRVPFVKDGTEKSCSSAEDVLRCLEDGKANRHVTGTKMNDESSRSHSIFCITLAQKNNESGENIAGKLFLVDLAGSEKVGKTGAEGQVLEEAKNINKSLSALGNVINALVEGNRVPYRDSKLTRILQESLGGNAKTTMVVCCSPSSYNEQETKSTLMFGMRAKSIKNQVQANVILTADEWRKRCQTQEALNKKLQTVIESLNDELRIWRSGQSVPVSEQFTESKYKAILAGSGGETGANKGIDDGGEPGDAGIIPTAIKVAADSSTDELQKQLDEKDVEISKLEEKVNKLEEKLGNASNITNRLHVETDEAGKMLIEAQIQNEHATSNMNEALGSLQDVSDELSQNLKKYEATLGENEKLTDELNSLKGLKDQVEMISDAIKKEMEVMQGRYFYKLTEILNELRDSGMLINKQFAPPTMGDTVDDMFTVVKLYSGKIKAECNTVKQQLEGSVGAPTFSNDDTIRSQISGLEEIIDQESQKIHGLRKEFITDLKEELKKAANKESVQKILESSGVVHEVQRGSQMQAEKIAGLQKSLNEVSKAHKCLIRENTDFSCKIPRLENHQGNLLERIKLLEKTLREARQASMRDRKRYQIQMDKIRESIFDRRPGRNVLCEIKAGQPNIKESDN